jgi:hypothetical protein
METNEFSNSNEDLHPVESLILEEATNAFGALKNHKAPSADNIPATLLNYGGYEVTNAIYHSKILIWEMKQIPDEWKKSMMYHP